MIKASFVSPRGSKVRANNKTGINFMFFFYCPQKAVYYTKGKNNQQRNYFSLNLSFKTTFYCQFFQNNRNNSKFYASCPLNDLSDKLLCIIFYLDVLYPWTLNLPIEKKSFLFMLKKVGKLPLINLHLQLFIMDIGYTWIYCQGEIFVNLAC